MTSTLLPILLLALLPLGSAAMTDTAEPAFQANGYIQLQSGMFVPLLSNGFTDHHNVGYMKFGTDTLDLTKPCDPRLAPTTCYAQDHGDKAGQLSMFRSTLQLEFDWRAGETVQLHSVVRGVRSLPLESDVWAQPPILTDPADRPEWVSDRYYNEFELREFYLDLYPNDWLSFRLGRQQVTWGETGQYRLLDVINPVDETWHFGPLESFRDTRKPLWIAKALIEFHDLDHNLELVFVPGLDAPEDLVTTPLTSVGAWGLPYPNTPSPFIIEEKRFLYPGTDPDHPEPWERMRAGGRWKGNLGTRTTYSLVYYYTHQMSPPVPLYYDLKVLNAKMGFVDNTRMETLYLGFPRQHIAGFTVDYTFDNPIGMVAKLETAIEPDRTFPRQSGTASKALDKDYGAGIERYRFDTAEKLAASYAVVLMRPTMLRWLNPTQNFLLVAQWMHTVVPGLSDVEKSDLVEIPGYNEYTVRTHSWKAIGAMTTTYFHGLLAPKLIGAYVSPRSGFLNLGLGIRLYDTWRLNLTAIDFFGADPYQGVGLFRDRDEVNLTAQCQF